MPSVRRSKRSRTDVLVILPEGMCGRLGWRAHVIDHNNCEAIDGRPPSCDRILPAIVLDLVRFVSQPRIKCYEVYLVAFWGREGEQECSQRQV